MRTAIKCMLTYGACCYILSTSSRIEEVNSRYIVQIHESLDDIEKDKEKIRLFASTIMTTKAGKRLECFLPKIGEIDAKESHYIREQSRLAYGNNAFHRIKPECLMYSMSNDERLFEVCPGLQIRETSLGALSKEDVLSIESNGDFRSLSQDTHTKKHYFFEAGLALTDDYNEEVGTRALYLTKDETIYTQYFASTAQKDKLAETAFKVQYICQTEFDKGDKVVAAHTSKSDNSISFLVASQIFCDRRYTSNYGDSYSLTSAKMADLAKSGCVKRMEGWWTYELCLNANIRQYHAEDDKTTAEFVLGKFDHLENENMVKTGQTLVHEHIDTTDHAMMPALLQIYNGGTPCQGELDETVQRESKVYIFCDEKTVDTFQILNIGETQTCQYSIQISTAAVCDHPHFISSSANTENQSEIIHCVPK